MKTCISCKEEISNHNVFTQAGWKEVEISGMCEVCFDNCTYPLEYNLHEFNHMNKDVIDCVKGMSGVVLAGGVLRKLVDADDVVCDYDLFLTDVTQLDQLKMYFVDKDYQKVFECPEGKLTTYRKGDNKVQIINKRPYKDCEDLINSFDITACCAAWDGENIYTNRRFISDVLNKKINFNVIEYPKATLNRIVKYGFKGYKLSRYANEYLLDVVSRFKWTDENSEFYID